MQRCWSTRPPHIPEPRVAWQEPGFAELFRERGVAMGDPIEIPVADEFGNVFQESVAGCAIWLKQYNQTFWLPKPVGLAPGIQATRRAAVKTAAVAPIDIGATIQPSSVQAYPPNSEPSQTQAGAPRNKLRAMYEHLLVALDGSRTRSGCSSTPSVAKAFGSTITLLRATVSAETLLAETAGSGQTLGDVSPVLDPTPILEADHEAAANIWNSVAARLRQHNLTVNVETSKDPPPTRSSSRAPRPQRH